MNEDEDNYEVELIDLGTVEQQTKGVSGQDCDNGGPPCQPNQRLPFSPFV